MSYKKRSSRIPRILLIHVFSMVVLVASSQKDANAQNSAQQEACDSLSASLRYNQFLEKFEQWDVSESVTEDWYYVYNPSLNGMRSATYSIFGFFQNGAVLSADVSDEASFEEHPDGILSLDELMDSVMKWKLREEGASGENTYRMKNKFIVFRKSGSNGAVDYWGWFGNSYVTLYTLSRINGYCSFREYKLYSKHQE